MDNIDTNRLGPITGPGSAPSLQPGPESTVILSTRPGSTPTLPAGPGSSAILSTRPGPESAPILSELRPGSTAHLDPDFVDRLKVAAATAVLKQKPPSMSGKEYAEQLAKRLRERDDTWRAKAKSLEMELLMANQELLLAKADVNALDKSRDIAASSAFSSNEADFLTPPSSSEECAKTDLKLALSKNTRFLHSLTALSSLSKAEPNSKSTHEVILRSVRTTVDFLRDRRRNGAANCSQKMFQEAADAVVTTLDAGVANGCRDQVVAMVTELVESLLDRILGNSDISNTFWQKESCCVIQCLSKSPHLLPTIIQALLQRIERTSASLRALRHHGNDLDVQLLENCYFLLSSMENILVGIQTSSSLTESKSRLPSSSSSSSTASRFRLASSSSSEEVRFGKKQVASLQGHQKPGEGAGQTLPKAATPLDSQVRPKGLALDQGFRTNVQQRLEDSLLHISHEFPLYAQYVWRLTGILDLTNEV